jgi:hypothetical protein
MAAVIMPENGARRQRARSLVDRNFSLFDPPCGVRQRFADVGFFQVGIRGKDFRNRSAGRDEADHGPDRDAQATNARLAADYVSDVP